LDLLQNKSLPQMLHLDGILVLEVATSWRCPQLELWELIKSKKYGSTEILFLRRTATHVAFNPVIASE
jgi:16S rRNA G966 N2-methylase RsmD